MNDFIKSISVRLRNPFVLSFIISWIFWNWRIVVGLLWYNSDTIIKLGYKNFYDLIACNANLWKNYVGPACFSIAFPYVKLGFSALQTLVNSIDEQNIKRISRKGFVPTIKYLDLRDEYENNIKRLSDIIEKESEVVNENLNLKTDLTEKQAQINKLKGEKDTKLKELKDTKGLLKSEKLENQQLTTEIDAIKQKRKK